MRDDFPLVRTLIAALVLSLVASVPASGHTTTDIDPDDTSGPLDIAAARHAHSCSVYINNGHQTCGKYILKYKITTYETWGSSELDGEFNYFALEIVRRFEDDSRDQRCYYINPGEGGSLEGRMFDICWPSPDKPIGEPRPVRRPDEHSLVGRFPKGFLGKKLDRYRMRMVSSWEREGDPDCSPGPTPPEKVYGECADTTRWLRGHLARRE